MRRLSTEARSAKADLRELRLASHQVRPPLAGRMKPLHRR